MLTKWHAVPMCIGDVEILITELEMKFDIGYVNNTWGVSGIILENIKPKVQDIMRLESDGSLRLRNGVRQHSYIGSAIPAAAKAYFDDNRDDLLAEVGIVEAEYEDA